MKTFELTGPALNYAVAVALGHRVRCWPAAEGIRKTPEISVLHPNTEWGTFDPATNWAIAGPLLDAANIDIKVASNAPRQYRADLAWAIPCPTGGVFCARAYGPNRLTAGLRCLVRSKLGDEVDIPKEPQ